MLGGQLPEGQGSDGLAIELQDFLAPLGFNRDKGHRVFRTFAEQKRAPPACTLFGPFKNVVYRLNHRVAGAEVGIQRMQAPRSSLTCAKIGVNVGAAKGIDRLFRVANQKQTGVGAVVFNPVDGLEDAVLHRVGVLKLVDQRHGELLTNQGRQAFAAFGLQCRIQAQQHVVETHLGAAAFFFFKTRTDPVRCMLQYSRVRGRQGIERGLETVHGVQPGMQRGGALPGFGHAVGGQAGETGAEIKLLLGFIRSPGAELFKPGLKIASLHFAAVNRFAGDTLQADIAQFLCPLQPRGFQLQQRLATLQQAGFDHLCGGLLSIGGLARAAKQRAHTRHQCRGAAPVGAYPVQCIAVHGVAKQPPVITQYFAQQVAVVGFQSLGKQAATVEGMLAQHALAPTVNGRNRSFIHPLGGDIETSGASGPLLGSKLVTQFLDESIRSLDLATEISRCFCQTGTNAVAQLFGRCIRKGHNEDLRWQ